MPSCFFIQQPISVFVVRRRAGLCVCRVKRGLGNFSRYALLINQFVCKVSPRDRFAPEYGGDEFFAVSRIVKIYQLFQAPDRFLKRRGGKASPAFANLGNRKFFRKPPPYLSLCFGRK